MPASTASDDSRTRFLDAADRVFIAEGYRGATIRAIAAEAGASLAILNRNWTGKQDLFAEVFKRQFDPIHARQNKLLDRLPQDGPEAIGAAAVQHILTAFLEPARAGPPRPGKPIGHAVYCRALIDPSSEAKHIVAGLIGDVRARVIAMLRKAAPRLSEADFFLAINVVMGVYLFPQVFGHQLATAMNVSEARIDWRRAPDRLAAFITHGMLDC